MSSNKGKNTPPSRIRGVFEEETPLILLGGEGGIRTPDELTPITVFKTAAFNRSATSPPTVRYSILYALNLESTLLLIDIILIMYFDFLRIIRLRRLAERQGFEPWVLLRVHTLSRRAV